MKPLFFVRPKPEDRPDIAATGDSGNRPTAKIIPMYRVLPVKKIARIIPLPLKTNLYDE